MVVCKCWSYVRSPQLLDTFVYWLFAVIRIRLSFPFENISDIKTLVTRQKVCFTESCLEVRYKHYLRSRSLNCKYSDLCSLLRCISSFAREWTVLVRHAGDPAIHDHAQAVVCFVRNKHSVLVASMPIKIPPLTARSDQTCLRAQLYEYDLQSSILQTKSWGTRYQISIVMAHFHDYTNYTCWQSSRAAV